MEQIDEGRDDILERMKADLDRVDPSGTRREEAYRSVLRAISKNASAVSPDGSILIEPDDTEESLKAKHEAARQRLCEATGYHRCTVQAAMLVGVYLTAKQHGTLGLTTVLSAEDFEYARAVIQHDLLIGVDVDPGGV